MKKIYVQLLDEGSDAVRPTMAEVLDNETFKILPTENYEVLMKYGSFHQEHWLGARRENGMVLSICWQ